MVSIKNSLITLFVMCCFNFLFAQSEVIKMIVPDTQRVKNMIKNARQQTLKGSDSSLHYAKLAKELALKIKFYKGVGNSYLEVGEYYNSKGNYEQSLKNFTECYRIHDSINYKHGMSNTMNAIGNVYLGLQNTTKALYSYKKSYEIAYNDSNNYMMCISLFGMANIYDINKQYNEALTSYKKTLRYIETEPKCKGFLSTYYINTSSVLNALNNNKQAVENLHKALLILKPTQDYYSIGEAYKMMGKVYSDLNLADSTIYYYTQSEKYLLKQNALDNVQDLYLEISNYYKKKNNYEKSLEYFIKHSIFKDSVLNISKSQQIIEIEKLHENRKIKKDISQISNELSSSKELIKQKEHENKIIYVSLSLLTLLLATIGYLFYKNRKANTILIQKNNEKDALVQEIHHRVKNNLQFVSSLINMQINASHNQTEIYSLNDASRRIRSMALVHEMLYNQDEVNGVSIKQYIAELTHSINDLINSNNLAIHFNLQVQDVNVGITQATALGMITSELISNSIKYAFEHIEKPSITISLQHFTNNLYTYTVKDNGCGLTQTNEEGNKLGMRLINIFSRQLKGDYTLQNSNGLQYQITFSI